MSVLRRPPPALSKLAASARFKKLGAAVTIPNDANVMLPNLIKYLLFIARYLLSLVTRHLSLVTAFETLVIPKSIPLASQPDYRSTPQDCFVQAAVALAAVAAAGHRAPVLGFPAEILARMDSRARHSTHLD